MNEARLVQGSTGKHLVNLTIPMFLGISSMFVASMIDIIYVGLIGSQELAAISFTFPVLMGMTTVTLGIGVGAASIIARMVGRGERALAPRMSTHALLLAALFVVALSSLMSVLQETLFRALGANAETLPLIAEYMDVWVLGLPLFALSMVSTMIMRAVGNARTPGFIMAGSAVLQVVMAPPLMFGLPGYADGLGLAGAAWAFVCSRAVIFLITLAALRRMRLLPWRIAGLPALMASWREVLAIGIPSAMTNLIGPASLAITVVLLAPHSNAVVAGFGIASRIEALATMVLMALAASTGPFVGQNWGAGQHARVLEAHRLAYRFALGYSLAICLVLAFWGRSVVGAISDDAAVGDAAYAYLLLVPATYGFLGVGMVASATFTALGKPMPALVLSLGRMAAVYAPLALVGDRLFGYQGVFAAAAVANLLIGALSAYWIKRHLRRSTGELAPQNPERQDQEDRHGNQVAQQAMPSAEQPGRG